MDSGMFNLRQVFIAALDMKYHTLPRPDTTALYETMVEDISLVPMIKGTHPQSGIGHFMGGYDAGYYAYLWSKVYSADMFSRFKKEGVMNGDLGRLYRRLILEPGRTFDEGGQLKKFLGREPNEDAFIESLGL